MASSSALGVMEGQWNQSARSVPARIIHSLFQPRLVKDWSSSQGQEGLPSVAAYVAQQSEFATMRRGVGELARQIKSLVNMELRTAKSEFATVSARIFGICPRHKLPGHAKMILQEKKEDPIGIDFS